MNTEQTSKNIFTYEPFGEDVNVKVDLANYATKTDTKIFCMLIL